MKQEILDFYLQTSIFTNFGPYTDYFKSLPNNLEDLAELVCHQVIHRTQMLRSNLGIKRDYENNEVLKIAKEYNWKNYHLHDDILLTAPAMMAELNRLDSRGFFMNREIKNKIIVTCRYVAVLMSSILKAKGIPTRVRSGFANYFCSKKEEKYYDHWIVQYYDMNRSRWINLDADGLYDVPFNQYDIPDKEFKWIAQVWLDVRSGKQQIKNFIHGENYTGLAMLARALFFDFHALMNNELSYLFAPHYIDTDKEFYNLNTEELKELDDLAKLLLDPDKNFSELQYLYNNDKRFHSINTPLLTDSEHLDMNFTYQKLGNNNLLIYERIFTDIFPNDEKSLEYIRKTINDSNENNSYFLTFINHDLVGITGYYELPKYPDDIFMGRFGILPKYRHNGFGKRIFLDTMNMVYHLDKKYLRIIVKPNLHEKVISFCKDYADICEDYQEDVQIYTKNLTKNQIVLWGKRYLDIKNE